MEAICIAPQPLETSTSNNQIPLSHSTGKGHIQWVCLKSGIQLILMDYTPSHPIHLTYAPADTPPLGFGFFLSGRSRVSEPEEIDVMPGPGLSFVSFNPNTADGAETLGTERIVRVGICMELEQFNSHIGGQMSFLAMPYKDSSYRAFCSLNRITTAMRTTISQILNCPYQGAAQNFFLESKALELVAHTIAQIQTFCSRGSRANPLPPSDMERVMEAARLLTCDLENTPDMNTLARSVGLSRASLYRQFQKVHGVPPFEYLRSHRLETAMQLLQAGEANVSEAAFLVGYSNMSHFTKAFKLMFGILPSELLNPNLA